MSSDCGSPWIASILQKREVCGCPEGPPDANYCAICGAWVRFLGVRVLLDPVMNPDTWRMEYK